MDNLIKYKNYYGTVEYSQEDRILHGKIEFINDLVTYEATSVQELEDEFKNAVEDYLETCKQIGKKPEKSFKGLFNVRIDPELHKKASFKALQKNISLNHFVEKAIAHEVSRSI